MEKLESWKLKVTDAVSLVLIFDVELSMYGFACVTWNWIKKESSNHSKLRQSTTLLRFLVMAFGDNSEENSAVHNLNRLYAQMPPNVCKPLASCRGQL